MTNGIGHNRSGFFDVSDPGTTRTHRDQEHRT